MLPKAEAIVFAENGFEMSGLKLASERASNGRIVLYSVFDTLSETENYARETGIKKDTSIGEKITEKTLED